MSIVAKEHPVVTCFPVELHVPFCPECDSHAAINSGLVQRVGGEDLVCGQADLIETEVGVETCYRNCCRLGELLPSLVQPASPDEVDVNRSPRIRMDHWIQGKGPLPDIPGREAQSVDRCRIYVKLIVVELQHQPNIRMKVISRPGIEIPARINPPCCSTQSFRETAAGVEGEPRRFLRATRSDQQKSDGRTQ